MNKQFSYTLRDLREKKNISQNQLAELLQVDRSAVAHWESGDRVPSTKLLVRLSEVFGVDVSTLIENKTEKSTAPVVMIVDDEAIALAGARKVVQEVLPAASVNTFNRCSEALDFLKNNKVSIALLDIEIGQTSGFDLSAKLHEINPNTTIIFLTAYPDYALDAWSTYATGFLVKPLKREELQKALSTLRPVHHPHN